MAEKHRLLFLTVNYFAAAGRVELFQEIADCRKCSVGTVKSYISRARRSLKKNLEKYL